MILAAAMDSRRAGGKRLEVRDGIVKYAANATSEFARGGIALGDNAAVSA
jgi:hypothetical protein